jgi:hypothetical protein
MMALVVAAGQGSAGRMFFFEKKNTTVRFKSPVFSIA